MNNSSEMRVTKRNGQVQDVSFDKILERVKKLGHEAGVTINYSALVMKVIDQLYDTIPTAKSMNWLRNNVRLSLQITQIMQVWRRVLLYLTTRKIQTRRFSK